MGVIFSFWGVIMLNNAVLASLKIKDKEYSVTDTNGLYIRVRPSGAKQWIYQKMINRKRVKITLGNYPDMSLKDARIKCSIITKEETQANESLTFNSIYKKWAEFKSSQIIHFKDIDLRFKKYLLPKFGDQIFADIKVTAVIESLKKDLGEQGKYETIKRICIYLKQIESYAINYGLVNNVRFQYISTVFPSPQKTNRASVPPEELPKVLSQILNYSGLTSLMWDIIRVSLYTLLRPGEYTQLKWQWIKDDVIIVPSSHMKMKREHRVPISSQLKALLEQRLHNSEYVFPSPFRKGFCYRHDSLPEFFRRCGLTGILVPHGIRSIGRTWFAEQRVPFDVAELCLAHRVGSATVQAYDCSDLLTERFKVMQLWCDYVEKCIFEAQKINKHI